MAHVVEIRIGQGFDVHPWAQGRPLLLGGVPFEGDAGLDGHSDGDVVCHALADAMLGAAALGDIGMHFPDTDPAMSGIGGLEVLSRTIAVLREGGFVPASVDLTIICERPAVAPRRDEMRRVLAGALDISVDRVSVKATRPEGLGLTADGIGCMALATISVEP
jgi:2-C-methyl-D-erythritol 2,4-cyclodiphosphate synthase